MDYDNSGRRRRRRNGERPHGLGKLVTSALVVSLLAVAISGAIWVSVMLSRVAKHRRRMLEKDYLLPSADTPLLKRLAASKLKAGDLIFTRVKSFKEQSLLNWSTDTHFMIRANIDLAFTLTKPFAPTHVGIIISPAGATTLHDVQILDFTKRGLRRITFAEWLTRRGMGTWRLWVATLNKTIAPFVVNKLTSALDTHKQKMFGVREIGYMLNRRHDLGIVRLLPSKYFALVVREHGSVDQEDDDGYAGALVTAPNMPPHSFLRVEHSKLRWTGLKEPVQTCSSLTYAILEYCGLVLPFHGIGSAVEMPPLVDENDEDVIAERSNVLPSHLRTIRVIRHPKELIPHDYLHIEFQWSPGVGIDEVHELDPFAIAIDAGLIDTST